MFGIRLAFGTMYMIYCNLDSPWVEVAMLLGWLGATLVIIVELVLLLFWIALVPNRGRELVLCPL